MKRYQTNIINSIYMSQIVQIHVIVFLCLFVCFHDKSKCLVSDLSRNQLILYFICVLYCLKSLCKKIHFLKLALSKYFTS